MRTRDQRPHAATTALRRQPEAELEWAPIVNWKSCIAAQMARAVVASHAARRMASLSSAKSVTP